MKSVYSCRSFSLFDYFSLLFYPPFFFFSVCVCVCVRFLSGEFTLPGSIIFMGCVISRAPIGLSFMEARNKTFPVARKLLGLQRGGTKCLQHPPTHPPPRAARDIPLAGALGDAAATLVRPWPTPCRRAGGEKQPCLVRNAAKRLNFSLLSPLATT